MDLAGWMDLRDGDPGAEGNCRGRPEKDGGKWPEQGTKSAPANVWIRPEQGTTLAPTNGRTPKQLEPDDAPRRHRPGQLRELSPQEPLVAAQREGGGG